MKSFAVSYVRTRKTGGVLAHGLYITNDFETEEEARKHEERNMLPDPNLNDPTVLVVEVCDENLVSFIKGR
jgi:hypothetical protein